MATLRQLEAMGDWIVDRDLARYHEREQDDGEHGDVDDTEVEHCDVSEAARGLEWTPNERHGARALSAM